MKLNVGETVICSITVKKNDTLTNPATSMTIKIDMTVPRTESKVSSTAMTQDSTGTYHYDNDTAGYDKGEYRATYTATDGSRITIELDTFTLI